MIATLVVVVMHCIALRSIAVFLMDQRCQLGGCLPHSIQHVSDFPLPVQHLTLLNIVSA